MSIRPFRIDIPAAAIDDLYRRIDDARWPSDMNLDADDPWSYGTPVDYLRQLADYWRHGFDWRAAEARINRFDQYLAEIDGRDVHFIHQRSPHADATPLLMVHGWPGSIVEFLEVIPRLTEPEKFGGNSEDAFHVICPSLPGYGFSAAALERGVAPRRIAESHAALMAMLGYDRFMAQGGDWGAVTSRYLPDVCPERMLGLHLNLAIPRPPEGVEDAMALLSEQDRKRVEGWAADEWMLTGYAHIQGTRPQTLAYGLLDSPVGLAAWITEKFREWSQNDGDLGDVISWDDLLTNISLYWFTGTIGTSARLYREHFDLLRQGILPRARCEVPTGLAIYPGELWLQPRAWAEREYDLVHWYDAPRGGHFAAFEQPALFSADLWSFHRTIRALRHAKDINFNDNEGEVQMTDSSGSGRFAGKRVLITGADVYMGPAICERFALEGATVIADRGKYLDDPLEPAAIVAEAGQIDVLVVNLFAAESFDTVTFELAVDATEAQWQNMFDRMVHPTMRFVKAVLPQMIERQAGKIIVVTSALPLRMIEMVSSYTAARGAQNAYVRAAGAEVARHNVQINAIGQNYVYGGYPDDAMERPHIREAVMRDVPARRLAQGWEQAELVLFLASENSNFICGQVIPFSGGWVT